MSISDAWDETKPGSSTRLNKMTIVTDSGTDLASLDKTKHKIVACDSTGSGFTLDHAYLFTADGTTAIDLVGTSAHTHNSSTDGGSLLNIYDANPAIIDLWVTKPTDLYEATWATPVYWNKAVTSTGSVENATDGTTGERSIRLRPNGTSGSGATISYPHLELDFSYPSQFICKLRFETASSLAFHSGVNADDITAADSNTRKYNVELCTTTNNNFFLRTANGSANSASDSGVAFSTSRVGLKVNHDPTAGTPVASLFVNAGSAFQKTTNIPIDGSTADNNLFKHSIKNNTAADRPMHVYGTRMSYRVEDEWVY